VPELHRLAAAAAAAAGDADGCVQALRAAHDIACQLGSTLHALRAAIALAQAPSPAARDDGRARLRALIAARHAAFDVDERASAERIVACAAA
jgi:hypothetical protein